MCIVIVTTAHPDYPLILLNNRDEYLHRPTAVADWWDPPHRHVLGGRDDHRAERGTWLGITKQGRLACLTNFREESMTLVEGRKSRGAVVNRFLKLAPNSQQTTEEVAEDLIREGVDGMGGFSLLFGRLSNPGKGSKGRSGLAIVSNRSQDVHDITWLCKEHGETHALSNSHFGDSSWPKVVDAERMVEETVKDSHAKDETKETLIVRLLDLLKTDSLPRQQPGEDWEKYLHQLRNSIFVPAIGRDNATPPISVDKPIADSGSSNATSNDNATSGLYGTQKQTVILVDRNGHVTFLERTLFRNHGQRIPVPEGDKTVDFEIEDW